MRHYPDFLQSALPLHDKVTNDSDFSRHVPLESKLKERATGRSGLPDICCIRRLSGIMGMCGRHCPLITCWKKIDMPLLDENAFRATFGSRMVRVQSDGNAPFPFWSYVDQIPSKDFQGYDCSEGSVQWVWRSEDGRFEHVLIDAKEDKDVFMVVVWT
jgi:hypothetical protein